MPGTHSLAIVINLRKPATTRSRKRRSERRLWGQRSSHFWVASSQMKDGALGILTTPLWSFQRAIWLHSPIHPEQGDTSRIIPERSTLILGRLT